MLLIACTDAWWSWEWARAALYKLCWSSAQMRSTASRHGPGRSSTVVVRSSNNILWGSRSRQVQVTKGHEYLPHTLMENLAKWQRQALLQQHGPC
jgi:hypothetical protein